MAVRHSSAVVAWFVIGQKWSCSSHPSRCPLDQNAYVGVVFQPQAPAAIRRALERLRQHAHRRREASEHAWTLRGKNRGYPRLSGVGCVLEVSSPQRSEGEHDPSTLPGVWGARYHSPLHEPLHQSGCRGARDPEVLRQFEQVGPRPMMEECEGANLWNGEMRGTLPADLVANGAHDARHGLHQLLGTPVGEGRCGRRSVPSLLSMSPIGRSHLSLHA